MAGAGERPKPPHIIANTVEPVGKMQFPDSPHLADLSLRENRNPNGIRIGAIPNRLGIKDHVLPEERSNAMGKGMEAMGTAPKANHSRRGKLR